MPMITARTLTLSDDWILYDQSTPAQRHDCAIPIDVQAILLAADEIPDPFYRDNEAAVQWVHERTWVAETRFQVEPEWLNQLAPHCA